MSVALQLARQVAAKDLSWVKTVGKEEKFVLAAQATLDAIDAAIAAEAPAKREFTAVSIDLGDGQTVTLKVSAADAKKLTEARSKRRTSFAGWSELELKSAVDALEEAIADETPAKKPEPLRIQIEPDTSALVEELEGAIAYLGSAKPGFATGIVTGKAPFGVVGERAGESVDLSSAVSDFRKLLDEGEAGTTFTIGIGSVTADADEVDRTTEWTMFGRRALPQLGEELEFTQTSKDGALQRSLVQVVEIWENADEGLLSKLTQRELEQIPASERTVYWVRHRNGEENAVAIDNLRRL